MLPWGGLWAWRGWAVFIEAWSKCSQWRSRRNAISKGLLGTWLLHAGSCTGVGWAWGSQEHSSFTCQGCPVDELSPGARERVHRHSLSCGAGPLQVSTSLQEVDCPRWVNARERVNSCPECAEEELGVRPAGVTYPICAHLKKRWKGRERERSSPTLVYCTGEPHRLKPLKRVAGTRALGPSCAVLCASRNLNQHRRYY